MVKNNIVYRNSELGINTVFYNEEDGTLGYSIGDTIYLNDFYSSDLDFVNKHEVLHFYEKSNLFKFIKDKLLRDKKINKLRAVYGFKYNDLYNQEDIDEGAIDNEIVIDLIVNDNDYLYNFIINGEKSFVDSKRYLNLLVPNRIKQQFSNLTRWEKIFVSNYFANKDNIIRSSKEKRYKMIREMIDNELERLYSLVDDKDYFLINCDSVELVREYEMIVKGLVRRGDSNKARYMEKNRYSELEKLAEKFSKLHHNEYKNIVELIKNSDYEPAFKCLMLLETLNKTYKQEKNDNDINNIIGKREKGVTICSHMNFNETVLSVIYNNIEEYSNFANLYFAGLSILNEKSYEKNEITLEGVSTFGKGKWIKFEGKKSNPKDYIRNSQVLSSMVQHTPWCTKHQASLHLEEGDFYLFVDNNNNPHLGVKLIGNRIDEVRGIKNENSQEIEEEYRDVAIEFLTRNKNIKFGKEWLDKEEWNNRLLGYCSKIDRRELSKLDVINMIHDLTEIRDYKAHYAQCSNRRILLEKIGNSRVIKKAIAKKYGCSSSEVFIGDIKVDLKKDKKFPYKVVLGNVDLDGVSYPFDTSSLKVVLGTLDLRNIKNVDLSNLEFVWGSLNLSGAKVDSIDNLEVVGEIADFYGVEIKSMKSLEEIGGTANFMLCNIGDLSSLRFIGEDARFEHAIIDDLSGLDKVCGNMLFYNSYINKLGAVECFGTISGKALQKSSANRR